VEFKVSSTWPRKYNILGVNMSATTYNGALNFVTDAAKAKMSACISHIPVHGLILGATNPKFRDILNNFEIVAPDGMPVKMALNLLYKAQLPNRVYGPEFMLRVCKMAASEKIGIYLYGSQPHVVYNLKKKLIDQFPSLQVVGYESPPFRALSSEEDNAVVKRINSSGARITFIGLGCPKQDIFAYDHKKSIGTIKICVGAAFDFLAGEKKMAPVWMQRNALEWLFRFLQEPRRLWRRYFVTNPIFLLMLFLQITGLKKFQSKK